MARAGGKGKSYLFRLKADHSGIVQLDGTTVADALAEASLVIGASSGNDILNKVDIKFDDAALPVVDLTQLKYDQAYLDFQEVACPKKATASTTTVEEMTDENGRKIGGAAGTGTEVAFLLIHYSNTGDDDKVAVEHYIVWFKKTSGSRSYEGGKWVVMPLNGSGIAAKQAITIPIALYDTAYVTAPVAAQTFPADYYEHIVLMDPAA